MNCADVDRILASQGRDALTPKQRRAVDEHLASCRDCRDAWAAYRGLMAEPVPVTPRGLRHRVRGALLAARPAKPREARPARLGVAIALLAGAAAASTLVYRGFEQEPAVSPPVVDGGYAPTAVSPDTRTAPAPRAAGRGAGAPNGGEREPNLVPAARDFPLDAYSVAVIAMPGPSVSPQIAGSFEQCHEYALRELRTIDGLNVVAGTQVSTYGDSRRPPEEIGREIGVRRVLVLRTASATRVEQIAAPPEDGLGSRVGSCYADLIDVRTSAGGTIAGQDSSRWTADNSRNFAVGVAWAVRNAILEDRGELVTRAQETVLDPALDDIRRVGALPTLRGGRPYGERPDTDELVRMAAEPLPGAFTEAVVEAVAHIGAASPHAAVRSYAWRYVRGVRDPNLTQALLYSLSTDGDAGVRCQAALALGYLADEPAVRDALMRAAVEDPSTEPPARGCIVSVRAAAQRALQSDDELRAASLRTVLDTSLPSASRLAPLHESIDGRGLPTVLDQIAAHAVFEMGRDAADARVRARAWESLSGSTQPAFTPTLLEDLARHAADDVRAAAAAALGQYAEEMQVRTALEQARVDPALAVRRAAQLALGAGGTQ